MEAVIMAGGKGRRLLPLTATRPKPMVPFINKPLIEYMMKNLKGTGIKKAVVLVDYLSDQIVRYLGNGEKYGIELVYVSHTEPYGTAGAVKLAMPHVTGAFLVVSADLLTNINLSEFIKHHEERGKGASIALSQVEKPLHFGIAIKDSEDRITRFLEKPKPEEVFSNLVNAGMYVIEKETMNHVPDGTNFDFSKDLFPKMMSMNEPLYGYAFSEYWNDVGRPSNYLFAIKDYFQGRYKVEEMQHPTMSVEEEGTLLTGTGCRIHGSVEVKGFAVLGDNVKLEMGVEISKSVIWSNTTIKEGVKIDETVVGENVLIEPDVIVDSGAVIGDNCIIGRESRIGQNIKVWCNSRLGEKTVMISD